MRKDAAAIEDEKKVEKRREKVIKEIDDRRNDILAEKNKEFVKNLTNYEFDQMKKEMQQLKIKNADLS